MNALEISIANRQSCLPVHESRLRKVLRSIFREAGISSGEISVAIVDDATLHQLNREFLDHDYPTDVISFVLDREENALFGEIIASADYAAAEAVRHNWPAEDELLLYLAHGALHLVGYDDTSPEAALLMRAREREVLAKFGLVPPGRE